MSTAEQGG